jgi:hypothetical protein
MKKYLPHSAITAEAVFEYIRRIFTPGTRWAVPSEDRLTWYVSDKSLNFSSVNWWQVSNHVILPKGSLLRRLFTFWRERKKYKEGVEAAAEMLRDIKINLPNYLVEFEADGALIDLYVNTHPGVISRINTDSLNREWCALTALRAKRAMATQPAPTALVEAPRLHGLPDLPPGEGGAPPKVKLNPDDPDIWQTMPVSMLLARAKEIRKEAGRTDE